jgi:hypothetical protein
MGPAKCCEKQRTKKDSINKQNVSKAVMIERNLRAK